MLARVRSCALVGIDAYFVEVEVDVGRGLPSFSTVGLPDAAVRESRERVLSAIKNSGLELPPRKIVVNLAPADTRKEGAGFDLAVAVGLLKATGQLSSGRIPDRPAGKPPGDQAGKQTGDRVGDPPGHPTGKLPCSATRHPPGNPPSRPIGDSIDEAVDGLTERCVFVGELSLDGRVKPVRGVLSMALLARESGVSWMIVPAENGDEASVALGEKVLTASTLLQVVQFLKGELELTSPTGPAPASPFVSSPTMNSGGDGLRADGKRARANPDFSEVKGQPHVRRALEVAAAGNHNILMIGPPGAGKTMLAKRVPSILPRLTTEEAIETTKIYSAAGKLRRGVALLSSRPFRSPHHTVSIAGAIGGGKVPRPGEVSLAHNGVLFLDELPEFRHDVLEALRQPLEEGNLTVSRACGTVSFPARFMFIAASNPCPCGYFTDSLRQCSCTPIQIRNYMARLSGPLLDRIDIHVSVPRVSFREISQTQASENSAGIRERVLKARMMQLERYAGLSGVRTNSDLGETLIRRFCIVDESGLAMLRAAMERLGLSGRAFHRILKVARTIADLDGAELPRAEHVAEAIQYRSLDRMQLTV